MVIQQLIRTLVESSRFVFNQEHVLLITNKLDQF